MEGPRPLRALRTRRQLGVQDSRRARADEDADACRAMAFASALDRAHESILRERERGEAMVAAIEARESAVERHFLEAVDAADAGVQARGRGEVVAAQPRAPVAQCGTLRRPAGAARGRQ